jgi:HSP20 family molecular chaperone IbpA
MWGGPWARPVPPRPPLPERSASAAEDDVRVETDADDENYYVIVHLAGMDPEKVQVQVRRRGLVVSSGMGWERRVMGPGAWETETEHRFFREFLSLPWDADVSRMSRKVEDGTLRIVIPRRGR